jgi:hypothetical protein
MAKNPAKNPSQKPHKNPWQQSAYANKNLLKIPCDKNLLGSAKNFCENINIKI